MPLRDQSPAFPRRTPPSANPRKTLARTDNAASVVDIHRPVFEICACEDEIQVRLVSHAMPIARAEVRIRKLSGRGRQPCTTMVLKGFRGSNPPLFLQRFASGQEFDRIPWHFATSKREAQIGSLRLLRFSLIFRWIFALGDPIAFALLMSARAYRYRLQKSDSIALAESFMHILFAVL
jgi:hypothetical protein